MGTRNCVKIKPCGEVLSPNGSLTRQEIKFNLNNCPNLWLVMGELLNGDKMFVFKYYFPSNSKFTKSTPIFVEFPGNPISPGYSISTDKVIWKDKGKNIFSYEYGFTFEPRVLIKEGIITYYQFDQSYKMTDQYLWINPQSMQTTN